MPGPGPHLIYTLASGAGMMHLSRGAFSSHHCLVYTLNAFLGPDIGSFLEWLSKTIGFGQEVGSKVMDFVHDPVFYILLLGPPFCFLYSRFSRSLLGYLPISSGLPLSAKQCLCLIAAGSLSHFFLDNLFEENGHTKMFTWILSTGWWQGAAALDPATVIVVGILCSGLLASFIYINRASVMKLPAESQATRALGCIAIVAILYSLWCSFKIYLLVPRQPAVGEEADLGVLVFLFVFFFLPHGLCVFSMHNNSSSREEDHFV